MHIIFKYVIILDITATMVWSIGMADNGKKKSQSPPNRTSEATNKYVVVEL